MGNMFAASLLSEQGAEVINIEPPGGDPLRQLTPFGREEYMLKDKVTGEPCGLDFLHELRNANSITLNLETEEGREIYKNMARRWTSSSRSGPRATWTPWASATGTCPRSTPG